MRVTILSGDVDECVPYLGTMRWVDGVIKNTDGIGTREPWPPEIGDGWTSWNTNQNVAGYFSTWNANDSDHTFTFATVKGTGNMVPEVKPRSALGLFYRFLKDLPMDAVEETSLIIIKQPTLDEAQLLTVVAEGGATPYSYQWFRDDIVVEGEYGASLSLADAMAGEEAEYHCHIVSTLGTTVWTEGVNAGSAAGSDAEAADELVRAHVAAFGATYVAGDVFFACVAFVVVHVQVHVQVHVRGGSLLPEPEGFLGSYTGSPSDGLLNNV